MNPQTMLYQLTETSKFMMSFVIVTKNNNCIVIDGGRKEDMPLLKEYVGGRHISAWILTHAHADHITGFIAEFAENGGADFDIERVCYNFPPISLLETASFPPWQEQFELELTSTLPKFLAIEPLLGDRRCIVTQGDRLEIDEVTIDFLYSYHEGLYSNLMNDSSLVFKLSTPNTSVLFLGDLGPEGGDQLYWESRHLLKADMVQMAHHGHMCCGMEIYAAIMPKACFWCCPDWLYNESELPDYYTDKEKMHPWKIEARRSRMYGTKMTRKWMEQLGVTTHYVTMNGTNAVPL